MIETVSISGGTSLLRWDVATRDVGTIDMLLP